jgi:hypothetical protein
MSEAVKPSVVMGVLRSTKGTSGNQFAARYRKHFWVVNTTKGLLECYKNDQAVVPKATIDAAQIAGVTVSKDKQNKFFELRVNLRRGKERRFRLNSKDERNRWLAAVGDLIKNRKSSNYRVDSIVSLIQKRLSECADLIRIDMALDVTRISSLRDDLLESCLQAAEFGIDVAKTVSASLSGIYAASSSNAAAAASRNTATGEGGSAGRTATASNSSQLRRIELTLLEASKGGTATLDTHSRYDPTSKTLFIAVLLVRDPTSGNVSFHYLDASVFMGMLTSNIWRDPNIEGWIVGDPQAQMVCAAITRVLQLRETFAVSLQWGPMVTDMHAAVAPYLVRHVKCSLLEEILSGIEKLLARDDDSDAAASRVDHLSRYVIGAAVRLDQDDIRHDRPPAIQLVHAMHDDPQLNAAFVVVSKFRKLTVMPGVGGSGGGSGGRSPVLDFVAQLRDVLSY